MQITMLKTMAGPGGIAEPGTVLTVGKDCTDQQAKEWLNPIGQYTVDELKTVRDQMDLDGIDAATIKTKVAKLSKDGKRLSPYARKYDSEQDRLAKRGVIRAIES